MYYLLSTVNKETDTAIEDEESRTELDSHPNMHGVGRHTYIISDMGELHMSIRLRWTTIQCK